jgi:bis(5'-nucleosyl)-tetraphosphatase (symmetrical)
MATWAIGDVHGCYRSLRRLLARRAFGPRDRLWFVGDLVNRGPRSLETLRFVADLGARATVVLGNHDVHFLAVAAGAAKPRPQDTLERLLAAPDLDRLAADLRGRPLLVSEGGTVLVHAGLLSPWTVSDAGRRARRAERSLRDPDLARPYLEAYRPRKSSDALPRGADPGVLETIRVMTLVRTVAADGTALYGYTGPLAERPAGSFGWFDAPGRRSARARIVCGHWAALGLLVRDDVIALDTGCAWSRAWGGALTAIRLDDLRIEQVDNLD